MFAVLVFDLASGFLYFVSALLSADHLTFCLLLITSLPHIMNLFISFNKLSNYNCIPFRLCRGTDYFANIKDAAGEPDWGGMLMAHGQLMGEQWQQLVGPDAKVKLLFPSPPFHNVSLHSTDRCQHWTSFQVTPPSARASYNNAHLYSVSFNGIWGLENTMYFMNLLTGKMLKWTTAVWEQRRKHTTSYEQFTELF